MRSDCILFGETVKILDVRQLRIPDVKVSRDESSSLLVARMNGANTAYQFNRHSKLRATINDERVA